METATPRRVPRGSRAGFGLTAAGAALLVTAAIVLAAWVTIGSRVAGALAVGLVGAVLADAALAGWAVGRPRLVLRAREEGVVGGAVSVGVAVTGTRGPVWVRLDGQDPPWVIAHGPGEGVVRLHPDRRGVHTRWGVELEAVTPLGLTRVHRRSVATAPTPLVVGPRRVPTAVDWERFADAARVDGAGAGEGEPPRGVRAYRPGDPPRSVHWPLTARSGELVVKERDGRAPAAVVVVADLSPGGPWARELVGPSQPPAGAEALDGEAGAEARAGVAAWVADEALRRGWRVQLVTHEPGGVVVAPVHSAAEVSRRLARATADPLRGGPSGAGAPPAEAEPEPVRVAPAAQRGWA